MDFREFVDDISGKRLTSPMYKNFIVAWILWNWNFVYLLIFGNSELILQEKGMLKYELLASYGMLSLNNLKYGFLFPVISVIIFTFAFKHVELWYRKHSNKNEIEQINTDIDLKTIKSNSRKADSDNKIEELEKKNEILKLEIENETKEKDKVIERLNSQLEILELENNKINASVGDGNILQNYDEFKNTRNGIAALRELKQLAIDPYYSDGFGNKTRIDEYKAEIDVYGLFDYSKDELTDLGREFLQYYMTHDED